MKPSQISQWLTKREMPTTEEDKSALALLSKTYPYFVPSRYIEAGAFHVKQPFAPALFSKMKLYMGDWIPFYYFLNDCSSKKTMILDAVEEDSFEDFHDEKPEYFFDSYENEQESAIKEEELGIPNNFNSNEADDFDFELFNERENTLPTSLQSDTSKKTTEPPATPIQPQPTTVVLDEPSAVEAELPNKEDPSRGAVTDTNSDTNETTSEQEELAEDTVNIAGQASQEASSETIFIQLQSTTEEPPLQENNTVELIVGEEPKVAEVVPMISFNTEKKTVEKKEEPLIQPLYAEDYFLHQGVANTETNNKQDEDKQLMVVMSFADWLMHFKTKTEKEKEEEKDQKALKTLWQKEKLVAALEEENEEIPEGVFEMAVNSIKIEDDLASEPLAEILIKQGKVDKAIEMYKKLSLRNPQKYAYFASKIEKLTKENL